MIINLPKLGNVRFDDNLTDEQFQSQLLALSQKYGFELPRPEYGILESGIRGVQRGAKRLGSTFGDVLPALGASALGFEDYAQRQMEEAAQTEREIQAENAPGFTSYKQIGGPGDFLKYAAETIGETAPDIASILIPGGVAGRVGRGVAEEAALQYAKSRALPTTAEAIAKRGVEGAAAGQAAGVYLGSYAVNTPDVFQSIYEQTGELAPGASLLFGSVVAALDAVLPGQLLKSMSQAEKMTVAEQILAKSGMKPGLLRKATAIIPVTAAKEGLTEGTQEVITAAAEKFVDDNQDLWSSDNFNRYIESAVRGAVAGGGFGAVQAGGEGLRARREEREKTQLEQALQQEEAARQQRLATGEAQQLPLFGPGEITPPPEMPAPEAGPEEYARPPRMAQTVFAGAPTEEEKLARVGEYEPVPSAIEGQGELFGKAKKGEALPPSKQVINSFKTAQAEIERRAKNVPENTPLGKLINQVRGELDVLGQRIETTSQKEVLKSLTAIPKNLVSLATRKKIEKAAKAAPTEVAPDTVLTAERLKEMGLKPVAGIFKRLKDKDIVENAEEIRAEIDNVSTNPDLGESTIKALKQLQTRLPAVEEPVAPPTEEVAPPTEEVAPPTEEAAAPEYTDFPIANLRRPNGAIGTQGITEEQVRGLLTNVAGLEVPESASMREMVDLFKASPEAQDKLRSFTESNPIQVTPLPDGTYHLRDGHHRAFLMNQLGDETIPTQLIEQKAAPARPAAELDLGTPEEVWDDADTGVPYAELSKANKDIWEQSLGRRDTQQIADNIAESHKRNVREQQRAKPEPETPLEEEFAGEQEAAEIDEVAEAKAKVGKELSKLVSSIGAKSNLTPEEQGSLSDFMSALGELMYALIKSGARSFKEALPLAKRRAREKLGELAKHVPDSAYKKAYDAVEKASKSETVKQRSKLQEAISGIGQRIESLPPATQPLVNNVLEVTSNMPDKLRQGVLSFMSLDQIYEVYGKIVPSLKNLIKALEVRASEAMFRREAVDKNVVRWYKLSKNYTTEQLQNFFNVANSTTVEQIDPLTITYVRDPKTGEFVRKYRLSPESAVVNNPIVQEFYKLPKELQQTYLELRQEYDKYGDELQNLILKNLSGSAASKMRSEFESKRLKVYLPLWRQGGYWLAYTDKNGEPVSMSFNSVKERNDEINRIKAQGVKEYEEFSRLEQISHGHRGAPPTGFVANIIGTMKQAKVPEAVLDQVYQSYLSLFPAESVRQMFRTRKGIEGYEKDVFQTYANVATRMANQLSRLNNAQPIDEAMNAIRQEADTDGSQVAKDVYANIDAQTNFLNDPTPTAWSSAASTFSYFWYIAGNVSSAIINLTQLPIVVYSVLGGEYGFDEAFNAMKNASSTYFNGGLDDNSSVMPDFTFGKNKNLSANHKRLYEEAVRRSVIRRSTGYELTDMRRHNVQDYTGTWAKVQKGLGWMFQNSERMNREVTLLAAFDLEFRRSGNVEQAIEKAIDVTKTSHGSALAETGPRIFQNGIGKVAFTFKRFAQSQLYLQQKLFRQAFLNADPQIRKLAQKQLAGIYGMAFIFAGAQGLPLYGAGSLLASMFMGDDDEPVDIDEYVRKAVGDTVYKGPLNQLFNIDIASRTGFNNLVWRDNPRRLAEVGPVSYMLEQFAGPAYSAFINAGRAKDLFAQGQTFKGLEAMTPSFVRNGIKGIRFGIEGALNKDGVPIVEDVNAYNVIMQAAGFAPADLSEAYARAGAMKQVEKGVLDRRVALLSRLNMAKDERDIEGIIEARDSIKEFSRKHPQKGVRISFETERKSYDTHKQRMREMVDGVHLNKYMRKELIDKYGAE